MVRIAEQRGGFEELVNGFEIARSEGIVNRSKRDQSEIDAHTVALQSYEHDIVTEKNDNPALFATRAFPPEINQFGNESELSAEPLPLYTTNNATSLNYASSLLVGSLALFHIAKNTPIAAVVCNIGRGLVAVSKHVVSFFSKNTVCKEQKQKTVLLSPTVKS